MKQKALLRFSNLFISLITCVFSFVNAQEVEEPALNSYCIAIEQSFESSGDCLNDPEYENADIILINDSGEGYETITINNDHLDVLQILPYHFTTLSSDNSLASLVNPLARTSTSVLTKAITKTVMI